MKNRNLLPQRFWSRVFNQPERNSFLVPNDKREPTVILAPSVAGMHSGVVVIHPKPYIDIPALNAGYAVATIMARLRKLGVNKGDRVAILAWNCPEWVWADLAIQSLGGITVPIYPNSAPEMVQYILRDSGARIVLSNEDSQLAKVDTASGVVTVHFDQMPVAFIASLGAQHKPFFRWFTPAVEGETGEIPATAWADVQTEMRCMQEAVLRPEQGGFANISRKDVATIIYTSGSTGVPKGGVITHGAIAAACEGLIAHGFTYKKNDRVLSYLPLAHVYERVDGTALAIWEGVPMGFCRVEDVGETLKVLRPTVLLGVPAVWRKIRDKILAKIAAETGLKKKLIDWALTQRQPGIGRYLADLLVFRKIRAELGGRLRILMSGGAPISPDILEFFALIGLELLQGYGLTETCGGLSVNLPSDEPTPDGATPNRVGSVGRVLPGVEVRIVALPGQEGKRDGEIWVRGELLFSGYWNLPEETAKCMTADGWFKTGDLGYMDDEGFLFITGRLKRLLKTDGGKYVAPEKIEKAMESEAIAQYVVPVGDGMPYISALIFVNQLEALQILARQNAPTPHGGATPAYLAEHPAVIAAVQAAIDNGNKKLERWESLKTFRIVPVEATVAAGLLTPTLKIRTEEVLKRYAEVIASIYHK